MLRQMAAESAQARVRGVRVRGRPGRLAGVGGMEKEASSWLLI